MSSLDRKKRNKKKRKEKKEADFPITTTLKITDLNIFFTFILSNLFKRAGKVHEKLILTNWLFCLYLQPILPLVYKYQNPSNVFQKL